MPPLGRFNSSETREKMRLAKLGTKRPDAVCVKIAKTLRGKNTQLMHRTATTANNGEIA